MNHVVGPLAPALRYQICTILYVGEQISLSVGNEPNIPNAHHSQDLSFESHHTNQKVVYSYWWIGFKEVFWMKVTEQYARYIVLHQSAFLILSRLHSGWLYVCCVFGQKVHAFVVLFKRWTRI